jgi:hypothetical protein
MAPRGDQRLLVLGLSIVTSLFLLLQFFYWPSTINFPTFPIFSLRGSGNEKLFSWGKPFQGYRLQSFHVNMDCVFQGYPICCVILESKNSSQSTFVTKSEATDRRGVRSCYTVKTYQPSPYEQRHLAKAHELLHIEDEVERRNMLADFIFEDLKASQTWLHRVDYHMNSRKAPPLSEDDLEYLSRFRVSRTCGRGNNRRSSTWYEWIEPLSVHARHPYALANCTGTGLELVHNLSLDQHGMLHRDGNTGKEHFQALDRSDYTLMNTDYVLLHNGEDIAEEVRYLAQPSRSYFFDAGTSTFDSSLYWFLCAYSQVKYMTSIILCRP